MPVLWKVPLLPPPPPPLSSRTMKFFHRICESGISFDLLRKKLAWTPRLSNSKIRKPLKSDCRGKNGKQLLTLQKFKALKVLKVLSLVKNPDKYSKTRLYDGPKSTILNSKMVHLGLFGHFWMIFWNFLWLLHPKFGFYYIIEMLTENHKSAFKKTLKVLSNSLKYSIEDFLFI